MAANGGWHAKKDANGGQDQLIHGLEDPWGVPPSTAGRPARPAMARRQNSALLLDADWGETGLTRRSKSLTLAELSVADRAQLAAPAPAEAPSRSWIKPFSRKKKAKAADVEPAEHSASASSASASGGRTTYTPAQLQRAASAGLPALPRRPASTTNGNGAARLDGAAPEAAPSSSARRFFTRSNDSMAKDRPVSAAAGAAAAARADAPPAALEPVERSGKSNTDGSSRWNPFSRGSGKSPAPTEPLAAAAGVQKSKGFQLHMHILNFVLDSVLRLLKALPCCMPIVHNCL